MDKFLMLRAGATIQRLFNMQDGFDIIEAGPGPVGFHRFYNKTEIENSYPGQARLAYDDVPFQKIGNNSVRFWVAYSAKFNILAFKEAK